MEITELQLAIYRLLQKEMEHLLILYIERNQERKRQRKQRLEGKSIKETEKSERIEKGSMKENEKADEIHRYQHILKEILKILLKNQ
jgi:hypothetical protein